MIAHSDVLSAYSKSHYLRTYSKVTASSPNCNKFFGLCCGGVRSDLEKPTDDVPEMKQFMVHCLCLSSGPVFVTAESN